jgi:hypothetical protein
VVGRRGKPEAEACLPLILQHNLGKEIGVVIAQLLAFNRIVSRKFDMLLLIPLERYGNLFLHLFYLKGQCHEMVVEERPWSGSLALN